MFTITRLKLQRTFGCCQKNLMLLGAGHFIGEKHKHEAKQSYR